MKLKEMFEPKLVSLDMISAAFDSAEKEDRVENYGDVDAFPWGGLPIYFFPRGSDKSSVVNKGDYLVREVGEDEIFVMTKSEFEKEYMK